MVSVIIPVYNEEKTIIVCLSSLVKQSYQPLEIIIVDDGSTDKTYKVLSEFPISNFQFPIRIFKQMHQGPGLARNLGAKTAKGEILVFADADMTFDKDFVKNLVAPIIEGKSKGTFTKNEYVSNWKNVWARCWNYNQGLGDNRRIPHNYPDESPVFRAILKSEFEKIGGFDPIGFTDDWTLSRKLKVNATLAINAICYHRNPDKLSEVYNQARWIGKNEFISGTPVRCILNLIRFNYIAQFFRGIWLCLIHKQPLYIVFQFVYYSGIQISILLSFFGEEKNK